MAPLVSHLKELNLLEATAYTQGQCFEAGVLFARSEVACRRPRRTTRSRAPSRKPCAASVESKSETILFQRFAATATST